MKEFLLTVVTGFVVFASNAACAEDVVNDAILFTNVNVFDGVSEKLIRHANVLVTGNMITAVSTEDLAIAGGRVIDGGGRTLMPGLSDTHVHLAMSSLPQAALLVGESSYAYIYSVGDAEAMLMRGVTSVRDMAGTRPGTAHLSFRIDDQPDRRARGFSFSHSAESKVWRRNPGVR